MSKFVRTALLLGGAARASAMVNKTKADYMHEKAAEAAAAAAEKANEAKRAAFEKVATMLDNLQAQILEEGEKEAATYNKFACFCKDTTKDKVAAIEAGKDDKATIETDINSLSLKRGELDTQIADAQTAIEGAEAEMKQAEGVRAENLHVYEKNAADLKSALTSLDNAIRELKASAKPSLLQLQSVRDSVRPALVLADAMDLGASGSTKMRRVAASFLQQPMQDYDFHSGDIIAMLEKLNDDFRAESADLDAEEVKSVAAHDAFMQEKTDFVKMKTDELDKANKHRDQTNEALGSASAELSTTSSTLLDDQQYLDELSQMCHNKAKTWDQRTTLRADELSMLKSVMDILHSTISNTTAAGTIRFVQTRASLPVAEFVAGDSSSMEEIEAAAEAVDAGGQAPIGFLQKMSRSMAVQRHRAAPKVQGDDADQRQVVAEFLGKEGRELKSTLLLSLARRMTADPFVKIKKLIQELIERLLQEAANEGNQKAWCDKATKDAEQKRDYAAREVEGLNAEMAELEALRDQLDEEFTVLAKEIAELEAARNTEESERAEEKAENAATAQAAKEGLEAVNMVLDILEKFYATSQKAAVSLAQKSRRGPMDDAPDAGFANGEANTGHQGTATGIIGMFEVMEGDFERTIAETEYAEKQAEQDFLKFMTETGMSLVKKQTADTEKRSYHADALNKLAAADESLVAEVDQMSKAILELLDLKPVCVDTGMSYEERVARREDEIKMLNKALCLLDISGSEGC